MQRRLLSSFSTFQASESTLQSAENWKLTVLYLPVNSIPRTQTHTWPLPVTFCLSFLSDKLWGQHQRLRWSQGCAGLSRHFQTRWWRLPQTKTSWQEPRLKDTPLHNVLKSSNSKLLKCSTCTPYYAHVWDSKNSTSLTESVMFTVKGEKWAESLNTSELRSI